MAVTQQSGHWGSGLMKKTGSQKSRVRVPLRSSLRWEKFLNLTLSLRLFTSFFEHWIMFSKKDADPSYLTPTVSSSVQASYYHNHHDKFIPVIIIIVIITNIIFTILMICNILILTVIIIIIIVITLYNTLYIINIIIFVIITI